MFNMRHVFTRIGLLMTLGSLWLPGFVHAGEVDLSIKSASIRFSETTLYAGETVRIYATVKNSGDIDATAQVFFYQSDTLIGASQIISVVAGGSDDVFVDYRLPAGSFNIRAVIQGAEPGDNNTANDMAMTPLFKTVSDDDRDGIENDQDNCVDDKNTDQSDIDHDGKGDECDRDMDGDGAANGDDEYPRDASKTKEVKTAPVIAVEQPVVEPVKQTPVAADEPQPAPVVTPSEDPEVLGENVETVIPTTEPATVAFDFSNHGYGGPVTSPAARFSVQQTSWRTYEFVAIPPLGGGEYTYAWDFGDGTTSAQHTVSHTFAASGLYTVTLATIATDGTVTSDTQSLSVSFFHFANPLLLATLAALVFILVGLLAMIRRLRRGEEV